MKRGRKGQEVGNTGQDHGCSGDPHPAATIRPQHCCVLTGLPALPSLITVPPGGGMAHAARGLPFYITPSARPTLANASSPKSRSSWLWAAVFITRMRALPWGTVG